MTTLTVLAAELTKKLADAVVQHSICHQQLCLEIKAAHIESVAKTLRDEFDFEQLIDLCGVDYSTYKQAEWKTESATDSGFSRGVGEQQAVPSTDRKFAVVYQLLSLKNNQRLMLKVYLDGEQPKIDSVISVWNCADWFEREAFDLYGILFDGHPDLRRILTDYGFIGHPFRKDFPLSGHVEVRYDAAAGRVIYEPVDIKPRVLVPRVIRDDSRYAGLEGAVAAKNSIEGQTDE